MSRTGFDTKTRAHAQHSSFYGMGGHEGQDERDSVSGSDDGNYIYHESTKGDFGLDDDHTALTSQTLNTDGTPKRPMNAFMIFARRRRPQVSAENQAMRTGEISKILSKEWSNMETSQKQFYQEQARQLKDTFNSKYPDYVYRRRPNNTRKKRKPDGPGQRPPDAHSVGDDAGFDDPGDSPTDGDDLHSPDTMTDLHRTRFGHDLLRSEKFRQPVSRSSPYSYPSHDSRSHETRPSYETSVGGDRMRQGEPLGHQPHTGSQSYSYVSTQGNGRAQAQPMSAFNGNSLDSNGDWNLRPSPWLGPEQTQDRDFAPLSAPKAERPIMPPSWHGSSIPSLNPASAPSLTLPTLNSPFYPTDSSQSLSPPSNSHSISPSSYSSHMHSPVLVGRDFGHHHLSLSPTLSISSQPYHTGTERTGLAQVPRQWDQVPRGLPPISNYSQLHPPFSPLSSSGGQHGFWSKD
ncbi:hypothetical protein C0991_000950 [Blastosporella zonata]|nr:hypothetical protein C0991_000950 [Blastosporella zonata]